MTAIDLVERWRTEDGEKRRAAVLERLRTKAGDRTWAGVLTDFPGVSEVEHQEDLRGIDLSGEALRGIDLDFVSLEGARFDRCDLTNARFQEAKLARASFQGAKLTETIFTGCNASDASFEGADLTGAFLNSCDLRGGRFSSASLNRVDFSRSRLDHADLTTAKRECDFYAATGHPVAAAHVVAEAFWKSLDSLDRFGWTRDSTSGNQVYRAFSTALRKRIVFVYDQRAHAVRVLKDELEIRDPFMLAADEPLSTAGDRMKAFARDVLDWLRSDSRRLERALPRSMPIDEMAA